MAWPEVFDVHEVDLASGRILGELVSRHKEIPGDVTIRCTTRAIEAGYEIARVRNERIGDCISYVLVSASAASGGLTLATVGRLAEALRVTDAEPEDDVFARWRELSQ